MTYEDMFVTHRYAQEVVDGARGGIGKLEKLACQRHLRDLERQCTPGFPYVFDESRADRIFDWFEKCCYHVRGAYAGQLIQLQPFQYFDIGCVFGWVHVTSGKRRFKFSYNERARGNVKSTEMAGTALYGMCGDAIYPPGHPELKEFEMAPEVECAAVDREQAKRVWLDACVMAEKSPDILKRLLIQKTKVTHRTRGGWMRALSKETRNKDSGAPCVIIVDEYHAHLTSKIVDTLKNGQGKRRQDIMFIITTAGEDAENSPCKETRDYCEMILEGDAEQEDWFVMIRELDKGDDPKDEANWTKANPILQHQSLYADDLRSQIRSECNEAYNSGNADKIRTFLIKRCDLWQMSSGKKYFDGIMEQWKSQAVPKAEFESYLTKLTIILGYDMSKKIDLTACGIVGNLADGRVLIDAHGFIPRESVQKHMLTDRVPYDFWEREGCVTVTDGALVDYDAITLYVNDLIKKFGVKVHEHCFDPYNAQLYMSQLDKKGEVVVEIRQGTLTLSEPTNYLREMTLANRVVHWGNPLLTWALSNAYVVTDNNENIKLNKRVKDDSQRIDPAAAVVDALVRLPKIEKKRSKYEDGGLVVF